MMLVALLPFAEAQSNPSLPQDEGPKSGDSAVVTLSKRVDEVDVLFTAGNRHHNAVTDLASDEVQIFDNSKIPSSIIHFESRTDLPLRVGVVIDRSGSVERRFAFEKDFASSLLQNLLNPTQDLGFVIGFNDVPQVTQELTGNVSRLTMALRNLQNGGATAIYDAVLRACQILQETRDVAPTRKVLILITDGDDNQSVATESDAIDVAIRANAVVFVVFTAVVDESMSPPPSHYGLMKKLAEETGGEILVGDKKSRLQKAFEKIETTLRSQYMIAYKPPAGFLPDGSYRKIRLECKRHGIHLFYRRGYYSGASANSR